MQVINKTNNNFNKLDTYSTFTKMKDTYLEAAVLLANRICTEAIWHKECCTWMTLSSEPHFNGTVDYSKLMGPTFYDGTTGVLHFLTAVYSMQPNYILEKTITGAVQNIMQQSKAMEQDKPGLLGLHTGWPGIALVLWNTGSVLHKSQYQKFAENLLSKSFNLAETGYGLDVIDGIAGAIPIFLHFHKITSETKYLDFAIKLSNVLLSKSTKEKDGLSWETMPDTLHNLTGYGHGTAGMAHAFMELYEVTKDNSYKDIADQVIHYENSHFNTTEQNWPDFRNFAMQQISEEENPIVCSCAWCHGAPGIGLSRLRCYEITNEEKYLKDAVIATETTGKMNKFGFGFNFSLCHGLLGNSELLLRTAAITGDKKYLENVYQIADKLVNEYIFENKILPSGLQSTAPVYDFMLGESGMGYFLLRLAAPEKFKNMLLFTP